jgi:hypothetical protein
MIDHWVTYLVLFIILIVIVYLIALSVVKLVEHKIGDIKIQMPKIQIVREQFEIDDRQPKNTKNLKNPKNSKKANDTDEEIDDNIKSSTQSTQSTQSPQSADEDNNSAEKRRGKNKIDSEFEDLKRLLNDDKPSSSSTRTPGGKNIKCSKDSDCNIVNGNGLNVCKEDGTCHCLSGSGMFCHYGPTNYKDTKDMTESELERFKYKYRNNFTLQDYKNWLMLYKEDPQHLRFHHRENLKILLRGGQISDKDIPQVRIKPPMDAADYFQKMYEGGKISVHFPEESSTGAMVGSNYNKFSDFLPPEEAENTWITGMVDIYNQPSKDSAKALNFYLRPSVTVGSERTLVGDNYINDLKDLHNKADIRDLAISQKTSLATFNSRMNDVSTDPTNQTLV